MVREALDWLAMWWRKGKGDSSCAKLAAALHSDRVLNGYYQAFLEKRTPDPAAALREIERCLDRRADLATLYHLKGRLLGALGAADEAIAAYTKCLEIEPKHELAAGFLALHLVQTQELQAGRALALATLAYDPHTARGCRLTFGHQSGRARGIADFL
jgi:tetratricopeptide (TPR) repeat protein